LFVLLGWLFSAVLPFGEAAWRVDLMCALAVAASVGLSFAVARSVALPPITSVLVALGFAVASVTWRDATRAEVQDLALLLRALALFFGIRYARVGAARDAFCMAFATGLAGATHGSALLLLPAVGLLAAARPESKQPRMLALGAAGVALGLLPYAYLPLRSAAVAAAHLDPTLALGLPAGAQPFWDYDHPATWSNFLRVARAADFDVRSGFGGFFDLGAYPRFAAVLLRRLAQAYGFAGMGLAALGAALFVGRRSPAGAALVIAGLLPVPYTESYRELQDPERYYLFTLWCAAIAVGAGFEFVADLFALPPRSMGRFAIAVVLVASFAAASPERGWFFAQRYERNAEWYVDDMIATTPDNALVVSEWAYATPLAYAAYVRHTFGRRVVVTAAPKQYLAKYRAWLATRPLYIVTFDDALRLPGFHAAPVGRSYYYVYHVTLEMRHERR